MDSADNTSQAPLLPAFYSGYSARDPDFAPPRRATPAARQPSDQLGDQQSHVGQTCTVKTGSSFHESHQMKLNKSNGNANDTGDAASKRNYVTSWLQTMVEPFSIPMEPSQEEFCQCLRDGNVLWHLLHKVNPEVVQMTLESEDNLSPSDKIKKFLSAAADMKLFVFPVSDLEQDAHLPSAAERIVDCLLSLKSVLEQKQSMDPQTNKIDEVLRCSNNISSASFASKALASPSSVVEKSNDLLARSTQKSPCQPRKRWVIPEHEGALELNTPAANNLLQQNVQKHKGWASFSADENHMPTSGQTGTGASSINVQHFSQKFRELLRLKTKGARQDLTSSENLEVLNNLENLSTQSLSGLVNILLGDKPQEDIATLIEYMLKKVIEEFEQRLVAQQEQVTKLKKTLKEHLMREDKLASRARVLETLAAGTGEEVKIVSSQLQKMKMEKKQAEEDKTSKEIQTKKLLKERDEFKMKAESLQKELDNVKQKDQQQLEQLKLQKETLEKNLQEKLHDLEVQLAESKKRMIEIETSSLEEKQALKKKNQQYGLFVDTQLHSFKDMKSGLQATKHEIICLQDAWQEEAEFLEYQLQGLVQAASGYHRVLAENRQLYNEVQDLKGNIRVYCRVRPFLPGQPARESSVEFVGETGDILISNPARQGKDSRRMFNFNKVFGTSATQEEVFMDTQPLIRSVLDGYNVCIFAYGQTGSGKTYTMSGPNSLSQQDWGVNYRALNDLFQISQSRKDVLKYEVGVQMIEIYNEQVRDLLFVDAANRRLEIRNNSQLNGLNVPDACMLPVNSSSDVFELMKIGQKNRVIGATALNERSSRSHSVLTVHVQGTELASGSVLRGCLHLVDLAGSERVVRSEATGDRLKEAQHINKSLSALGDVVSALAQKNAHVPYRNSKLTQLLQDSLGGQAKTLMFVHISPDVESYGETLSTLKFAERVASVELGAARSNKESREVRDLKEQISVLKEVVAKKDGEISRLQSMKTSSYDSLSGLERTKKLFVEAQQQKMRRQTLDTSSHKEKRLTGRLPQEVPTREPESISPPSSPTKLKGPPSRAAREAPAKGGKLGRTGVSGGRISDIGADMKDANKRAVQDSTMESGASLPKDWLDRLHSSTDSSLFGTASVDDLSFTWDTAFVERTGSQPCVSDSVAVSSQVKGEMGKDWQFHAMNAPKQVDSGSFSRNSAALSVPSKEDTAIGNEFESHTTRNTSEAANNWLQEKELDTSSELSEGDVSQAETEASLSSMAEEAVTNRKRDLKKTTQGQRKLSLLQMPRPSRGDWKSLNSALSTHTHSRRYSTAGTLSLGLDSFSKPEQDLGTKQTMDGGTASCSSDGGGASLSAYNVSKSSSKRR